jgi:hypothetical protein
MNSALRGITKTRERCYVDERGCWIWKGCMTNGAVPFANIGSRQYVTVMRYAYCLKNNVPYDSLKGLRVWSKMRDVHDVNPDHAMVGTIADHNLWRAEGGRLRGPHRHIIGKKIRDKVGRRYTPEQICEIRASGETEKVLGERYGCTASLIGHIRRGKIYNTSAPASSVFSFGGAL